MLKLHQNLIKKTSQSEVIIAQVESIEKRELRLCYLREEYDFQANSNGTNCHDSLLVGKVKKSV